MSCSNFKKGIIRSCRWRASRSLLRCPSSLAYAGATQRPMITHPIFKPCFHVERFGEEGVFLLTETSQVLLRGRLYCTLAPLLDGQRSTDELVDLLEEEATIAEVYYALARLEQQGYIVEAD